MDTTTSYTGDLNDISVTSIYYADSGSTNRPSGINGYVSTIVANPNYMTQHFTTYDEGQNFTRVKKNGTWSSWMGGYVTGTITSDFPHQSTPYLYKVGNVVTFFVYISINGTITNNTPLAYFSVGFRPMIPVQVFGMFLGGSEDGCNAFFQVNPNGCLYQNYGLSIAAQKIAVEGTYSVL